MTVREIIKEPSTKIVDVRTKQEFDMGHLENAVNIPLDSIPANAGEIKDLNAPFIVFYCRSGSRSGQAVNYLKQLGLQNVFNGGSIEDLNSLLN